MQVLRVSPGALPAQAEALRAEVRAFVAEHLAGGVHAAVGAACCHHRGGSMRIELGQGRFQRLLNAGITGLTLPAAVNVTVVLQAEGDAAQGRGTFRGVGRGRGGGDRHRS